VFFDCLLGRFAFPPDAHPEYHFGSDGEQEQSAGNAKRRQRDLQRLQKPVADECRAGEYRSGNDAGADGYAVLGRAWQALGDGEKSRCQADRVHHHEQGQKGRDGVIQWHLQQQS
jgi:hypothetical protein